MFYPISDVYARHCRMGEKKGHHHQLKLDLDEPLEGHEEAQQQDGGRLVVHGTGVGEEEEEEKGEAECLQSTTTEQSSSQGKGCCRILDR